VDNVQRRLIPLPNQSEEEYQAWLKTVKPIPWLKQSDLLWIQKQRRERREDAIMKIIHSDGLEEWRKKHGCR